MADSPPHAPRLIVFSDTTRVVPGSMLAHFSALAERAQKNRVLFVLRDYALGTRARLALGQELSKLSERTEQRFGLADRADLARALGCTAFHLPGSGLKAEDARKYLGARVFLSRGTHDPLCELEPELDALLLSPIFDARKGRPAFGLSALHSARAARAAAATRPALYALGGVEAYNAASCLSAGATGVAVIGAALAADPAPLLAALGILRG